MSQNPKGQKIKDKNEVLRELQEGKIEVGEITPQVVDYHLEGVRGGADLGVLGKEVKSERGEGVVEGGKKEKGIDALIQKSEKIEASPWKQKMDDKVDKYVTYDEEKKKMRFMNFSEVIGEDGEEKNILKKIWQIVSHPWEYLKYWFYSREKEEFVRYAYARKGMEYAEKGLEVAKTGETVVEETGETRTKVGVAKKAGVEGVKGSYEAAKISSEKWSATAEERFRKIAQDGPEKFTEKMSSSAQKMTEEIESLGPAGIKAVEQGKFRGFSLRHSLTGTTIAFSFLTCKEAFRAIRHGDAGEFTAEVTSSKWWGDMAELLPVVGSIQSFRRLDDYSTGLPDWARWGEFLVNAGLDTLFLAPIVVGTIAGGLPGAGFAAARVGIGKGATTGIKSIAKMFGKKALKEGAELGIEKGAKEVVIKGAEKSAVRLTAKESAILLSKNILKKMSPQNWKSLWPYIKWQAGMEVALMAVGWAWDNFAREKTIEIGTNVAMKNMTPIEQKAAKMALGKMRP